MSELATEQGAEAPAAAPEAAAPEPADQLAAGEVAGTAADAAAEPATQQDPFDLGGLESQAELDQLRSQYQELEGLLQQAMDAGFGPQQQQGASPIDQLSAQLVDEYGQLNPAAFAQFMAARDQALLGTIDQRLQALSQPWAEQAEAANEARGEERLNDIIADDIARNGEYASTPEADAAARRNIMERAQSIFEDLAETYGESPRTAELAMRRAAADERAYIRAIRGEGATEQTNRLATLAGAPADAGAGAAGAVNGPPAFKSPGEVTRYYAQEGRRLADAAGGGY